MVLGQFVKGKNSTNIGKYKSWLTLYKLYISDKFKDQRYNYFAKKIIFNEAPNVLPKEIFSEINRKNAKRLLSKNDEKWNTLPKAYNEIDNLRSKYEDENDAERLKLLEELNNFLMQIEKNLSDA